MCRPHPIKRVKRVVRENKRTIIFTAVGVYVTYNYCRHKYNI